MSPICITPSAENDLVGIWVYIAQDNPQAADDVYQAVENTFKILLSSPHIGTLYQAKRLRLKGVRFFPVNRFKNYVIYYREQPNGIEIIRVLHTHMDKLKHLGV